MTPSLEGWDITQAADVEWLAWGEAGDARAKVLGSADGSLVEAQAGYAGTYHEHTHAEFLYVLAGTLGSQGRTMQAGVAYAAAAGSVHSEFAAESDATYLSIFKL